MIRPYLRDMINNQRTLLKNLSGKIFNNNLRGKWKIRLTMQINFTSSLDHGEICTMESKSKNIEILMGSETDDIINELFEFFLEEY